MMLTSKRPHGSINVGVDSAYHSHDIISVRAGNKLGRRSAGFRCRPAAVRQHSEQRGGHQSVGFASLKISVASYKLLWGFSRRPRCPTTPTPH